MRPEEYEPDLALLAGTTLPPGWMWGTGQSAYQTEGGLNDAVGPRNDWYLWEAHGRIEPTGIACDFWNQPELILDRVAAAGLNSLRISAEWARVEPSPGQVDTAALDRYADIVALARDRSIDVHLCAWHFTHPQWLGPEPWLLDPDATVARSTAHVARLAGHIGDRLAGHGMAPPHWWLTMNEINVLPLAAYVFGAMPPGRSGRLGTALRMMDALGTAHVSAYHAIHAVYRDRGWRAPMVSTNNSAIGAYELDLMLIDVLTGRTDLTDRAAEFSHLLRQAPKDGGGVVPALFERLSRTALARGRRQGHLSRTSAAVAADGPALDWVAADWYTPFLASFVRRPGRRAVGDSRAWTPQLQPWEQRPNPAGVRWYLGLCGRYGLPVVLVENGMCSPGWAPRPDGWDRATFLRAHVSAVLGALADGVPMRGYLHWSMTDNYEWGSYLPRFGLHAADRDAGTVTIAETDALGGRPAQTLRAIVSCWDDAGRPDEQAVRAAFAALPPAP